MKKTVISLAVLTALSGCTTTMTEKVTTQYQAQESTIAELLKKQESRVSPNTATTKVTKAYFGSKSIPFKNDLVLPEVFRIPKRFDYANETFTLAQAASRISRDTGIPIRISQDVYSIPASTGGGSSTAPQAGPTPAPVPAMPPMPGGSSGSTGDNTVKTATDSLDSITLDYTATPAAVLDQLCLLNGLNWEYRNGVAVIQRLVTRVFPIKASPGSIAFDFAAGKNNAGTSANESSGGGTITAGLTSTSSVRKSGLMAAMENIQSTLEGTKTTYGKILPDMAAGTITVIDTIDGIDRAAKVIERQNEILSRRATFKVDIISFKMKNSDQSGADLNAVFSNLGKFGATLTAPTTIVNNTGGSLSMQLLSGTGSQGRFDGSTALFKLLSEVGTANTINSLTVETKNRVITPVASLTQTVYLAKTTPGLVSSGTNTPAAPGLEPGTATTGLDIKLQPNISDSNQIDLMFSVGLVDLLGIKTITSGTGSSQQSIEAPETSGFEFLQDVSLQPGVTTVLSGYERTVSQYNRRTLGREAPMIAGGSFTGDSNREKIFILITPTIVGTPK